MNRESNIDNELLFHKFTFLNQVLKKRNANKKTISHGQGRILAILHRKDGISTKELSEILNIKVTSLNETLNKLIKAGYLKKETSQKDKRVLLIYLTEKGRDFRPPKPKDADVFDCLSEEEKENLDRYLERIAVELHNKFKDEDPEKYEEIIEHRKKVFEKYFDCDMKAIEWFKIIEKR